MTIMSPPAAGPGTSCTHDVTRHGVAPRVALAAATRQPHTGHSIERMDQPPLDLVTTTPAPIEAESRPWIYEQVLALVAQGRAWTDNRSRRWIYDGGATPANRMPEQQQLALTVLYAQGHVRIVSDRIDMPAPDCRTLRARRYQTTASGAELHTRWAALSPYSA